MGNLLIVDDDTDVLEVLKDILEFSGHQVSTADSGRKALEKLSEQQTDLALVDLKMDDISGLDVLKVIQDKFPETIVIILTGFASLDYAIESLRLGAYDFLQKPINQELLLRAIDRGLEKKQLRDLSEAVIRKMNEGLALLSSEESLHFTNEQLPQILGYSSEELQGKPFVSIVAPEDERSVVQSLRQAQQGTPQRLQSALIRKDGTELKAIVSFTSIGRDVLTVVSDVSEILGPSVLGEDFTYRVEPGKIYLVEEEKPQKAMEALIELMNAGYKGTMITRRHADEIRAEWGTEIPVLRLTEEVSGESTLFPDISLIERKLDPLLTRNRVVLLDCLHYLVSRNSFDLVLNAIQRKRDLVFMRKSIIIFSVDQRTFTERELSLLEKEMCLLLPIAKPDIREDLLELLSYLSKRNEVGIKPHHKEIGKKFNITRTTVRQRLKLLEEKGLIVEGKRGRTKIVEITERGRKTINQSA